MMTYPRGSEWRCWDLHVHSPLSILNNNFQNLDTGEPDWESYVARIEDSGVAAVGVTDYFTIDGYKVLQSYQKAGRLQGILLLPNIEFRLNILIHPRGGHGPARRLDFHVIFAEDVLPQDIEDHFLHDLKFVYEQKPYTADNKYRLKKANLQHLGKTLKEQHASFTASDIQVGATNAVVSLEDILGVLRANERFRERYLLILAVDDWNQISWDGQDHLTRKTLLQAAHMVFASNSQTIAWCLGTDPYTDGPDSFAREFGSLKPCVHGSDAHSLHDIARPCAKRGSRDHDCGQDTADCEFRYCWIKADPTFEGLKQILYEPLERVRIQASSPTPLKSNYSIDQIDIEGTVINEDLSLRAVTLDLNDGLIAVTGGRGSGKTAFVDLIANSYIDRARSDDPNSFVRRISDDHPQLPVRLSFKNGETFKKIVGDTIFFDRADVVYIAQGELESRVSNASDLNQYINGLVFDSSHIKNSVTAFEYFSLSDKVDQAEQHIADLNTEIDQLERQTTADNLAAIEKEDRRVVAKLQDVVMRLEEYDKTISPAQRTAATQRQQSLTMLQKEKTTLLDLERAVSDALAILKSHAKDLSGAIAQINQLAAELGITSIVLKQPVYPGTNTLRMAKECGGRTHPRSRWKG